MLPDIRARQPCTRPRSCACVATVKNGLHRGGSGMSTGLCEKSRWARSPCGWCHCAGKRYISVNRQTEVAVMVAVLPVVAFAAMEMLPLFESRSSASPQRPSHGLEAKR